MRIAPLVALVCLLAAACGSSNATTQTVTVTTGGGGGASTPTGGGTSGTTQPPSSTNSKPIPLHLVSAGYSEYLSGGDRQLDYYALIKNPNTHKTFDQAEVDLDFLSASGTVVDSEQEYANYILPGQTFPVVGSAFNPPTTPIAKIQVRIGSPYNWIGDAHHGLLLSHLTGLQLTDNYGLYEAKGVVAIHSTFTKQIKQSPVIILFFSQHGNFVGFDQEYANFVPPLGKAEQSFDTFPHATVGHVQVYAGLDNTSTLGTQSLM